MTKTTATIESQNRAMQRYYVLQSRFYDLTRWSFLFGRRRLMQVLPFGREAKVKMLEVGCGTGYNLARLAQRFPKAQLLGLDVSTHMIRKARRNTAAFAARVELQAQPYRAGEASRAGQYDAILFSYSLTMINPQWRDLILQAKADLRPGGFIAVTDFHDSRLPWFKRHMGNNYVRMDGHLLPLLRQEFTALHDETKPAYGGLWRYFVFVGKKLE
jgi:S-adenosylmethionine-diacylgycerolhomoserine-N-methlytransferase